MTSTAMIFADTGVEEIELITVVDVLRRGGVTVEIVSLTGSKEVTGAHHITIIAERLFSTDLQSDFFILPGGSVLESYLKNGELQSMLREQIAQDKWIAAICAAPCLLGDMGVLQGKRAVCYPGMESHLKDAIVTDNLVEIDAKIVTSQAPATALLFALEILSIINAKQAAEVAAAMHVSLLV